jgi:hypothetical protein
MGQYHYIVNLDKKEFVNPGKFGDGLKLMEFGLSGRGAMAALAVLLSNSRHMGGGDLNSDDTEYYGRWAGDRIVIAGDYAGEGDACEKDGDNIYTQCLCGGYWDVSEKTRNVILKAGEDIG